MVINWLRRDGARTYWVWIKGQKEDTKQRVWGDTKDEAIFTFAKYFNVKTVECDGKWIR